MSPAERARDRQAKASGGKHSPSDYKGVVTAKSKTNRATLRKGK